MNLNPTIIVAVISAAAAIFAALVTASFATANSHYTFRSPKKYSILEEQLHQVFAPLQLLMQSETSREERSAQALNIMNSHFVLVPPELYQSRSRDAFPHLVEACYHTARKKLGYTQVMPHTKCSHITELSRVEEIIAPSRRARLHIKCLPGSRTCTLETLLEQLDRVE